MKALSVKQPWADAIIYGGKDIENRGWSTKFRGLFLIHAGKSVDKNAPDWVWDVVREHSPGVPLLGGIIGSVELIDVVEESKSLWYQKDSKGFVLKDPRPLPFIPLKGQLGFFEVNL